jgi:hypothetical protein
MRAFIEELASTNVEAVANETHNTLIFPGTPVAHSVVKLVR